MSDEKPREEPLVGWEEIARHFGLSAAHAKDVLARLPVDPLVVRRRGHYVYAYPSELDEWRRRTTRKTGAPAVSLKINPKTGRTVKVVSYQGIEASIAEHAARLGLTEKAFHLRLLRSGRPSSRASRAKS